jgi:hypothetical protein
LKFLGEVWAGRACAVLNEEDLTTYAKRARNGRFGVFFEKNGLKPLGFKLNFLKFLMKYNSNISTIRN